MDIDRSVDRGQEFYKSFFSALDRRTDLTGIRPDTKVVWNGHPLLGRDALVQLLAESPTTKHKVSSLNVHALPASTVVNVLGSVHMGPDAVTEQFGFNAVFVLDAGAPPGVCSFSYRLVFKPQQTTLG